MRNETLLLLNRNYILNSSTIKNVTTNRSKTYFSYDSIVISADSDYCFMFFTHGFGNFVCWDQQKLKLVFWFRLTPIDTYFRALTLLFVQFRRSRATFNTQYDKWSFAVMYFITSHIIFEPVVNQKHAKRSSSYRQIKISDTNDDFNRLISVVVHRIFIKH